MATSPLHSEISFVSYPYPVHVAATSREYFYTFSNSNARNAKRELQVVPLKDLQATPLAIPLPFNVQVTTAVATSSPVDMVAFGTERGNIGLMWYSSRTMVFWNHPIETGDEEYRALASVTALCWLIPGVLLVSGHEDGYMVVWDVASENRYVALTPFPAHHTTVCSLSLSANGRMVASTGADGLIRFWQWNGDRDAPSFNVVQEIRHEIARDLGAARYIPGLGACFHPKDSARIAVPRWDRRGVELWQLPQDSSYPGS